MLKPHERIYVALDTPDDERALALARQLEGRVGGFKIGLELYSSHGPEIVRRVRRHGPVFLDLKFHDIPNTVRGAAAVTGRLGVEWFTMHAAGGPEMLRAGDEGATLAALDAGFRAPRPLAVTVLTSLGATDLERIGLRGPAAEAVDRLARLAAEAGVGDLVCSAEEITRLRGLLPEARLVVPGIRPAAARVAGDDQIRVATPGRAVTDGADLLVIGRPITAAHDPLATVAAIAAEIDGATRAGS